MCECNWREVVKCELWGPSASTSKGDGGEPAGETDHERLGRQLEERKATKQGGRRTESLRVSSLSSQLT